MTKDVRDIKTQPTTNNNKNDVTVNNNFSITINFGDSINLLAIIAGISLIRRIAKKHKQKTNCPPDKDK